jgi:tetratricopeptide (TPR) repeat protein/CHAT domain-containing protein
VRATVFALVIYLLVLAVSSGLGTPRASAQDEAEIDALNLKAAQLYQARNYGEAMVLAREALALAEQRFAPQDARLAKLLNNVALLHEMLKQYAEAEPFYRRALSIEEVALGPAHATVGKTLKDLAGLYARQKRFAEAEPLYQRAITVLEQAAGPEPGNLLAALNGYANLYRQQGRFREALPLYQRCLAVAETAAGPDHPDLAPALERLAGLYEVLGRDLDAEPLWARALAIMEKARGVEHLDLRPWLQRLASNYEHQRRYGEAERLYQRAIAITEQGLGPDSIDLDPWLDKLAHAYHLQNRYPEAEAILKRALVLMEKARGQSHADLRRPLDSLAWNYEMQRRYADALPLYQRTLAILEMALGPEHRDLREPLAKLASVYEAQRRYDEAAPLRQRALASAEKAYGHDDPSIRTSLNSLAFLYKRQGRYREAEPLYKRVLALVEKAQGGPDNPSASSARAELIEVYNAQARYGEAEPLLRAELAAAERKAVADANNVIGKMGLHNARNQLGRLLRDTNRPSEAEALFRRALADDEKLDEQQAFQDLVNLGGVLHDLNRLAEAEPLLRRALALAENYGPNYEQAKALNSLGALLAETNRPAEAETLFRRALQLAESFGYGPHIATALNNLAGLLQDSNRLAEAEALYRRALAIEEQTFGSEHPSVATRLNNLATLLQRSKRSEAAEPLFRRALAIGEKSLGPDHPKVALRLGNLADLLVAAERRAEAEPLLRRALAIDEASYGAQHPRVAGDLNSLAGLLKDTHGVEAAEPLLRRALAIDEESYGLQHPHVARDLHNLAVLRALAGDWVGAEQLLARATPIWIGRSGGHTDPEQDDLTKGMLREHTNVLRFHALALNRAEADNAAKRARGFEVAQWALQSEAAEALAQMSARLAKGEGPLVDLARRRQDLVASRHNEDKRLLAAVGQADAGAVQALRASIASVETDLAAIDAELKEKFPDYASFATPKPLSIAEVQTLLNADEALLLFLDVKQLAGLPEQTLVWALTRKTATWHRTPMGTRALADSVQALRCGLDEAVWNDAASAEQCLAVLQKPREEIEGDGQGSRLLPFDLERAHGLYQALLGPLERVIRGKQLIIVPSGALLSLPFNVLVTEPPKPQVTAGLAAYRQAAWLGIRQPISMLPSVASLAALRRHAKRSTAPDPFLGYGDPLLAGEPGCPKIAVPDACPDEAIRIAGTRHSASRSGKGPATIASYFREGQANVAEVRKLCPLPDTAHELKCVARSLGAQPGTVVLGKDMTERAVKTAALNRYRVLHFATHGLIAGEVAQLGKGRAEPALVLSPPEQATEEDDGLLTASEVAALKLDADWVVLSACNTASGGEAGAEALSGLARAFFYAGARALLVSHWPVDSYAATVLTSHTFAAMRKFRGLGRAEAFRRAMLALSSDDKRPWAAHPSIWAPFTVVGAGAELQPAAPTAVAGASGKSRAGKAVTAVSEDWHKRAFEP